MKLNTTLIAVALAFAGTAASAATVGTLRDLTTGAAQLDNPTLGPDGLGVHADFQNMGTVDDVYNFHIGAPTNLAVTATEFESDVTQLSPADFILYSGNTTGSTTGFSKVGSTFSFGGATTGTLFTGLTTGDYFFEVAGDATKVFGGNYTVTLRATDVTPPLLVPEPANMALLLAGLGLMGFMAKRRARD